MSYDRIGSKLMTKYWIYRNNKVDGPYAVDELLKLPGYHAKSLVAPENPDRRHGLWNLASNIPELAVSRPASASAAPDPLSSSDLSEVGKLLEKTAQLEARIAQLQAGQNKAVDMPREIQQMLEEKARVDDIMVKVEALTASPPVESFPAASRTYTILNIDDDANIRRLLKLRLELKGCRVLSQENGPDALAYLEESSSAKPDLIICDVMMPGMDGYEVCRRIRAQGIAVPFLFLTSKGSSVEKVRGIEAGADDYILKPFDPHELEAKVARHLGTSFARAEKNK